MAKPKISLATLAVTNPACAPGHNGDVAGALFVQVWEARGRYPEASRAAFDVLLESLDAALSGEKDSTLASVLGWSRFLEASKEIWER